jgi:ubiquinone/menaquinone biosynthesis C-methylase UbiE
MDISKRELLNGLEFLRCPKCHGDLDINSASILLICNKDSSHRFPVVEGIPSFVRREEISPEDAKWVFEYDEMAERYDEAVKEYDRWLGVSLQEEFREVTERIPVKPSQNVLDISTGTGAMFIRFNEVYSTFAAKLVGVDLSMGMLGVAHRKFEAAGIEALLLHAQVKELPLKDASFDLVTHSGGINTFSDTPATLKEWVRVLKPEGTLLIADEGLSPSARKTQRGVQIVEDNRLFGLLPPLEHLPPQLKNIELRWIARDTFYTITCQKLSIDELKQLKTNGTEQMHIKAMVAGMLKGAANSEKRA